MRRQVVSIRCLAWLAWLVLNAATSGCDLAEDDIYSLRIVSPENDATFTDRDDVDPNAEGMQVAVRVEAEQDGLPIELVRLTGGAPDVIARGTVMQGAESFPAVTLLPGANRLMARDADSGRSSLPITVYYEDPCGAITFLDPAPPADGSDLVLGPDDDADESACGEAFSMPLLAATGLPDGTRISVLADSEPVALGVTHGGTLSIPAVPLDRRGAAIRLSLRIEGRACEGVDFPAGVLVDCAGPACDIQGFNNGDVLSSERDLGSDIPGLDLDIVVGSDISGLGQPVELVINGDQENAIVATARVQTDQIAARFSRIALPDGPLRVQATCSDAAGARSVSRRTLTVDTLGCAVEIQSPSPSQVFVAPARDGTLAVDVSATISGSDCESARFLAAPGPDCAGWRDAPAVLLAVGQRSLTRPVTLAADGDQFLCVGTVDLRGNPSLSALPVRFENRAPELAITAPADALAVSRLGDALHTADLDPATDACEQDLTVSCGLAGGSVSIVRAPDGVVLGEAPCSMQNVASFASLPLPSQDDASSYAVVARQTGRNGLVGESPPLWVEADCRPPRLAFASVDCGVGALGSADDEDPGAAGLQHTLRILNTPNPKPEITLVLSQGGTALGTFESSDHHGAETWFAGLSLPAGLVTFEACASDPAGNHACTAACDVMVGDVPQVAFISPSSEGALLSPDLSASGVSYHAGPPPPIDCDPAPGFQIPVQASTFGAAAGASARVSLRLADGTLLDATSVAVQGQGDVVACLTAPTSGQDLVLRIEVDAETAGLYGAAERRIHVDLEAPATAATLTSLGPSCRDSAVLSFFETADADLGEPLRWDLRCAAQPIDDDPAFATANPMPGNPVAVQHPTGQLELQWTLSGLRAGETLHCAVRGYDGAGAYSPLSNGVTLTVPALRQRAIAAPEELALGAGEMDRQQLTPLGDVNGDGFDDVLWSGGPALGLGAAALFFGSEAGLGATPGVRFASSDSYGLGQTAVALGNFDGDPQGLSDFALAAPDSARVFLILGRTTWPAGSVTLDAGGCAADVCVQGDPGLGSSLTSLRFDVDAAPDLAVADDAAIVVLLGQAGLTRLASLGAVGAGTCLDARARPVQDACGSHASAPARGFRIAIPARPDQLTSTEPGALFALHRGASPSLWRAAGRDYAQAGGLQPIERSDPSLSLLLALPTAPSLARARLVAVGDLDGDGVRDAALSTENRVTALLGDGAGGLDLGFAFLNDLAQEADDRFGADLASGYHGELGLLGDLDGDGLADLLAGSEQSLDARGSVDLFYGQSASAGLNRGRSSRALRFDDDTIDVPLDPGAQGAPYPRRGQYLGDLDGDGQLELGVLEEQFQAGAGRVIVVGECAP